MEPRVLLATYTVVNVTDADPGSLRWAITQVNQDTGAGSIAFRIPGSGLQTIALKSPLPIITNSVVIDGSTQPGGGGHLAVRLDGAKAGPDSDGIVLAGGSSVVKGLVVTGFGGAGVVLHGGGGNLIQSCILGADPTGTLAIPNGDGVLLVGSSLNTIGGILPGQGNLISGNLDNGIAMRPDDQGMESSGNAVLGNRIGTTADGTSALGNQGDGILIISAAGNIIGGQDAGAGNLISSNRNGMELSSFTEQTLIQGNLIGTTADGRRALGNQRDGILLDASSSNTIGGGSTGAGNVISANGGHGVDLVRGSSGNAFQNNFIGTDATGTLRLGNQGNGVNLASGGNSVGGFSSGTGNTIAFNGSGAIGAGVQLVGQVNHNTILSNSIHDNAGLGINLGNGPTPNHPPGSGPGPNDFVNFPVFSTAVTDGATTKLQGNITGAPGTSVHIQVFSNPAPDPSGYGEGMNLLGNFQATTDALGQGRFDVNLPPAGPGFYLSATATDGSGNTSEFSPGIAALGMTDLRVSIAGTPDPVGVAGTMTYTVTVMNVGILDAHNVVLTNTLPGMVSLVSVTSSQGATPVVTGQGISVALGTIHGGGSATLSILVQVGGQVGQSLTDSAKVTLDELDANPSDNAASFTTHVASQADLSVAIAPSSSQLDFGSDLTLTMTAANLGPAQAGHAVVTLPLPPALVLTSATTTQGTVSVSNGVLIATLGSLVTKAPVIITVNAHAFEAGTVSLEATIASDAYDPELRNNDATTIVTIAPVADLAVSIQTAAGPVADGQGVVYTVVAANVGSTAATGVTLVNVLPAGVSFHSASVDGGGDPSEHAGVVTAVIGSLAPGDEATLTITAQVSAPAGTTLVNSATVSGIEHDPTPTNNADSATTMVREPSNLSVSLTPAVGSVPIGQPLAYTLVVANSGPSDEPDATLTIPLPANVEVVTCSPPPGAAVLPADGQLSVNLGPIASGTSETLTLVIAPRAGAIGSLTLAASVEGENANLDPAGATASATVDVLPASGLAIAIVAPPGPARQGLDLAYTLVVTNTGPSPDPNVVATARLPDGLQFLSATGMVAQPSYLSGVVTMPCGAVDVGQSVSFTVVVRPTIASPAPGLVLSGNVAGDAFDPFTSDNSASVNVPVQPSVDLGLALSCTETGHVAGQPFTVVASVTNGGPSNATGVTLTIPLAASARFVAAAGPADSRIQGGTLFASIGTIPAGESVAMVVTLEPLMFGPLTLLANVVGDQFDLNPADNSANLATPIAEPPGTLDFASSLVTVPETAGVAAVQVVRTLGTRGSVTVHYRTVGGNATPGVDYQPVSGDLTFADGEATRTILVPILANPHDNHDEYVAVVIESPGQGALLGTVTTAVVRIQDLDPDFTPPTVTSVNWDGPASSISSIVVTFSETVLVGAANPGMIRIDDLGTSGSATFAGSPIGLAAIVAAPGSGGSTFTIIPSQPLAAGHFYRIHVSGTGSSPVHDLAGNSLAGAGVGQSGTDYVAIIGRGTTLKYYDDTGDLVTLRLTGGGYLDEIRGPQGEGKVLRVQDAVSRKSVLSGSVARAKGRGAGTTSLGTIEGLGQFGDVRVRLSAPRFTVRQYPFFLNRGKVLATKARAKVPAKKPILPAVKHPKPVAQPHAKRK